MRRRLVAVSLPVVGVVAGAPPALAARPGRADSGASEARVTWAPLRDRAGRAVDDGHASGALMIGADVTAPGGLTGWSLAVDPAGAGSPYPGFGTVCREYYPSAVTRAEVRCPWETARRKGGEAAANQGYAIRITIDDGTDGGEVRDGTRSVVVSNPAGAPEGLRIDRSAGRIHLSWAPAREPDAAGYSVSRRRAGGPWTAVATPENPTWDDTPDTPGRYRYSIGTRRRDAPSAPPANWTTSGEVAAGDGDADPGQSSPSDAPRSDSDPDHRTDTPAGDDPRPADDPRRSGSRRSGEDRRSAEAPRSAGAPPGGDGPGSGQGAPADSGPRDRRDRPAPRRRRGRPDPASDDRPSDGPPPSSEPPARQGGRTPSSEPPARRGGRTPSSEPPARRGGPPPSGDPPPPTADPSPPGSYSGPPSGPPPGPPPADTGPAGTRSGDGSPAPAPAPAPPPPRPAGSREVQAAQVPAPPPTGPPAPAPVQEWSVALPAATRSPLRHRAAPGAPGRAGPAPVHDRSPDPAPPAEPGDSDSGFSVGLPYGPAVATPAAAGPLTGPGAPDLSGPPGGPPRSGLAREAPAPDDGPDQRRRPLTALALGQVCCLLALQTRYLLHRAVSHRLGRGARRTAHRCPSCRAHLAHVA